MVIRKYIFFLMELCKKKSMEKQHLVSEEETEEWKNENLQMFENYNPKKYI